MDFCEKFSNYSFQPNLSAKSKVNTAIPSNLQNFTNNIGRNKKILQKIFQSNSIVHCKLRCVKISLKKFFFIAATSTKKNCIINRRHHNQRGKIYQNRNFSHRGNWLRNELKVRRLWVRKKNELFTFKAKRCIKGNSQLMHSLCAHCIVLSSTVHTSRYLNFKWARNFKSDSFQNI